MGGAQCSQAPHGARNESDGAPMLRVSLSLLNGSDYTERTVANPQERAPLPRGLKRGRSYHDDDSEFITKTASAVGQRDFGLGCE